MCVCVCVCVWKKEKVHPSDSLVKSNKNEAYLLFAESHEAKLKTANLCWLSWFEQTELQVIICLVSNYLYSIQSVSVLFEIVVS